MKVGRSPREFRVRLRKGVYLSSRSYLIGEHSEKEFTTVLPIPFCQDVQWKIVKTLFREMCGISGLRRMPRALVLAVLVKRTCFRPVFESC